MTIDAFDRAISSLYDAALDDGGWEKAIEDVASAIGGRRAACFQVIDHTALEHEAFAFTGVTDELYSGPMLEQWISNDVWGQEFARRKSAPGVAIGHELVPHDTFRRSTFMNEIIEPFNLPIYDLAAAVIDVGGTQAILSVYADRDRPIFDASDKAMLQRLYPHIQRAARSHASLAAMREKLTVSSGMLDQLPFGIVFLDEQLRIVGSNSTAQGLVESGTTLSVRAGRIFCVDQFEDAELQAALRRAIGERPNCASTQLKCVSGADLKLYGVADSRPWSVVVSPLTSQNEFHHLAGDARVVLTFSNHAPMVDLNAARVALVFGLTPQETALLAKLASGYPLNLIADETGRSVGTLRTHLKSIFQKTERNTQAQLVQLVLSAPMGPT